MRYLIDKYYNIFFRIFNDKDTWICYEIVPTLHNGIPRQPCIFDNCKLRFYNSTGSIDSSRHFLYKPIDIRQNSTINILKNTNDNLNQSFDATVKIYVVLTNGDSDAFIYNKAILHFNEQTFLYDQHPFFNFTYQAIRENIQNFLHKERNISYDLSTDEFSVLTFKYGLNNILESFLLHIDIEPDFSDTSDAHPFCDYHYHFFTSFINTFIANSLTTFYSDWKQI